MKGAKLDVFFPGFPTLKHIKHVAQLNKSSVRVFEQASRGQYSVKINNCSLQYKACDLIQYHLEVWGLTVSQ